MKTIIKMFASLDKFNIENESTSYYSNANNHYWENMAQFDDYKLFFGLSEAKCLKHTPKAHHIHSLFCE
jgi:hypothetical protein